MRALRLTLLLATAMILPQAGSAGTITFALQGELWWVLGTSPHPDLPLQDVDCRPCVPIPFSGTLTFDPDTENTGPLAQYRYQFRAPPSGIRFDFQGFSIFSDPDLTSLSIQVFDADASSASGTDGVLVASNFNLSSTGASVDSFLLHFQGPPDSFTGSGLPDEATDFPASRYTTGDLFYPSVQFIGCMNSNPTYFCGPNPVDPFKLIGNITGIARVVPEPSFLALLGAAFASSRTRRRNEHL